MFLPGGQQVRCCLAASAQATGSLWRGAGQLATVSGRGTLSLSGLFGPPPVCLPCLGLSAKARRTPQGRGPGRPLKGSADTRSRTFIPLSSPTACVRVLCLTDLQHPIVQDRIAKPAPEV